MAKQAEQDQQNAPAGQVGFIGLGTMGGPMARNLAARLGAESGMWVFDTSPHALDDIKTMHGVHVASAPREIAETCNIIITCLPDDAAVEAVYRGPQGISGALRKGLTTLDCSTVSPGLTGELEAQWRKAGAQHLTAPMLGSKAQSEAGQIFFILGGALPGVRDITPYLSMMGRMHIFVGDAVTASKIKLLHNALGAVNYAAVAEALGLCVTAGVDLKTFYDVVRNGGGMAFGNYFDRKVPSIIDGDYSPRFKLALAHKDHMLARGFISGVHMETPILDAARDMLEGALAEGHGDEDASTVTRVMEHRLRTTISKK